MQPTSFFTFLALTLASGVVAMPRSIAERGNIDPSGSCGGSTGFVCASGQCCSQYGYCGTGTGFCDGSSGSDSGSDSGADSGGSKTTAATPAKTSAAASSSGGDKDTSSSSSSGGSSGGSGSYTYFKGNGATSAGWPSEDKWTTFDKMWSSNLSTMKSSCTQFQADNNSDDEISDLKSAIQSVAKSTGVDERFVMAIVMQESKGCVRAPTTNYGVENPGLMQDHAGSHTCAGVNPCPKDQIVGMIQDGTGGTSAGDGLKQLLASAKGDGAQKYYVAARMYNSGSVDASGNLEAGIATHCYSSDVANRLTGWSSGETSCTAD